MKSYKDFFYGLFSKATPQKTLYLCEAELYRGKHYLYDISSKIAANTAEEAKKTFENNHKYLGADLFNVVVLPLKPEIVFSSVAGHGDVQ